MPGQCGGSSPNDNGLVAGNYTITVTDANGCVETAMVTVTQPPPITVSFSADSLNGCAPVCANFKDLSTDPNGVITKWNWIYSDGVQRQLKTQDIALPSGFI